MENRIDALCDLSPGFVKSMAPYQPGRPVAWLANKIGKSEKQIVKLASNENPNGLSPKISQAVKKALGELTRYPDGNSSALKAELCDKFGVDEDGIILGNGSNDVLDLAARSFLQKGTSAIYSEHGFIVYHLATKGTGAEGIVVPAKHFGHDLDGMVSDIREDTRIIFIANPNNPTGTWIEPKIVEAFLESVPQTILVVIDEAYHEYLEPERKSDHLRWLKKFPNLLITRTFSKAYGLAGLRVGFGFAHPKIVNLMNRVRQPFNVNYLAQVAAIAALNDDNFIAKSVAQNREGMDQLITAFKRLGLRWIPSYANFVAVEINNAEQVYERLLARGIIVRPITGYKMPCYLRISIGLERENSLFVKELEKIIK